MSINTRATIEDFYKVDGKAELVNGEIVEVPPTGDEPGMAGGEIFARLREHARQVGGGRAYPNGVDFMSTFLIANHSARMPPIISALAFGMRFLEGAPVFAVEVRSESDYDPRAERAMQDKRADYFAAGTLVVWDVDLQSAEVIKSYKVSDSENPVSFRRGDLADAELAVPGWRMRVDEMFG